MDKSGLKFKTKPLPESNPRTTSEIVSFDDLKTKVLAPKCLACHAKWTDEVGFQAKHINLGDPINSKMFDAVKAGRMPKGPKLPDGTRAPVEVLSTEELELFYNYILNAKSAAPVIAPVTFEEVKIKVLDAKCITCHKKWSDEAGFQLKYVTPGEAEKSKMYLSVKNARMPKAPKNLDGTPGTVVPLSPEEQELIKNYINGLK